MSATIVGGGIVGLYTAYCLVELGQVPASQICIVAKYLPGDQSASGYTSPWAGGNWSCISPSDENTLFYDRYTYENLGKLQKTLLKHFEGHDEEWLGLARRPTRELWDYMPAERKIASLASYLEDYRVLSQAELDQFRPSAPAFGISFKTWNFNCPVFLCNLAEFLRSRGIKFVRAELTHLAQATAYVNGELKGNRMIFNCTGLGSHDLGGVKDHKVYPARGQVVVARVPHVNENCLRWGRDYATYVIPRPGSLKELVLGGFLQVDNWNAEDTSLAETEDILQRTTTLLPKIGDKNDLQILRVAAGLRPSRYGGPRLEREYQDGLVIVHNYGASGYGYQGGLGMGYRAMKLALTGSKF